MNDYTRLTNEELAALRAEHLPIDIPGAPYPTGCAVCGGVKRPCQPLRLTEEVTRLRPAAEKALESRLDIYDDGTWFCHVCQSGEIIGPDDNRQHGDDCWVGQLHAALAAAAPETVGES